MSTNDPNDCHWKKEKCGTTLAAFILASCTYMLQPATTFHAMSQICETSKDNCLRVMSTTWLAVVARLLQPSKQERESCPLLPASKNLHWHRYMKIASVVSWNPKKEMCPKHWQKLWGWLQHWTGAGTRHASIFNPVPAANEKHPVWAQLLLRRSILFARNSEKSWHRHMLLFQPCKASNIELWSGMHTGT